MGVLNGPAPEIPGYRLAEAPIRHVVEEFWNAKGSRKPFSRSPVKGSHQWFDKRETGKRYVRRFKDPGGRWIRLEDWTMTGPDRWDRKNNAGPRARVMCDYGGAYIWTDGACDTLEGVAGPDVCRSDLEARFDAWQGQWDSLNLYDEGNRSASPPQGWRAWSAEGLQLCRELLTYMGSDGLLIYEHSIPLKRPEYYAAGSIALYWEPINGQDSALVRQLLSP